MGIIARVSSAKKTVALWEAFMELFVFHRTIGADAACLRAGVDGVVVDLEVQGKARRQNGFDTQINDHNLNDVSAAKRELGAFIICRVNSISSSSKSEFNEVIAAGANEILVPMVKTEREAYRAIELADGRCGVGLMIETAEAVEIAATIDELSIARIFVGLNDLCLSYGNKSIFDAIRDGTVQDIRRKIKKVKFGLAGLTLPDCGEPLAAQHLFNELSRLRCDYTFLRRSFFRDTKTQQPQYAIPCIKDAIAAAEMRSAEAMKTDARLLLAALDEIAGRN